jgi:stage II sporulation protein D
VACLLRAEVTYRVQLTTTEGGRIVEVPAETYVAAVLAGESSTFRSNEALKAMAVAARTFAAYFKSRHASQGFDFCSTTHCQRLVLNGISSRFTKAAEDTRGLLLWFEARPAFTVYTRNCSGRSEDVQAVWPGVRAPYLIVRDDPYCTGHRVDAWKWLASGPAITDALRTAKLRAPVELQQVSIVEHTRSGRARLLLLSGRGSSERIGAESFRLAIGRTLGWNSIRSDQYRVERSGENIFFTGAGQGHGVGLCQDGADEMGSEGSTFRDILQFYYPGTSVSRLATGIGWNKLSNGTVVLFTTHPNRDQLLLQTAAIHMQYLQTRWHMAFLSPPEIFVYPDMDTFRNGTGEPGWIAAHTQGNRIELQPVDTLKSRGLLHSTLRHELAHVLIESRAKPGVPLWFREGLVENLAGTASNHEGSGIPRTADLAQRNDRALADAAHTASASEVAELIRRYGMDELLRWVTNGVPPAVLHSSTSNIPAKSR